jgi:hypothetical protein
MAAPAPKPKASEMVAPANGELKSKPKAKKPDAKKPVVKKKAIKKKKHKVNPYGS